VKECPLHAIFPESEVPAAFRATGGEFINARGLSGYYEAVNHHGETVILETTRALAPGEVVDLRTSIQLNQQFFG
jgi:hypothetical protein